MTHIRRICVYHGGHTVGFCDIHVSA